MSDFQAAPEVPFQGTGTEVIYHSDAAFAARPARAVFWPFSVIVINDRQHGVMLLRCAALACILLVLLLAGVEAMHAHSDAANVRSSPCAICLSVHGNAPAITYHLLPTLSAIETLALPAIAESHGILRELSLFIRPPPIA